MSTVIDRTNAGSLALRQVVQSYGNLPPEAMEPFVLSRTAPYFGFVDVQIDSCAQIAMFSNNDDFVAKQYFWNGPDAYERMSLKLWSRLSKNSAVILDIGSYTGVYSLAAAAANRKSRIYAFEAVDMVYSRLLVNRDANGFANIRAMNIAISDREGAAEINVYAGDSVLSTGSSLLDKNVGRPVVTKKAVRSGKLDDVVHELKIDRVDLMKIDAEGAEHLIFRGGRQMLQRFKPDIICEVLREDNIAEIDALLSQEGYRYFRILENEQKLSAIDKITASAGSSNLNILITCKTEEKIQSMLSR